MAKGGFMTDQTRLDRLNQGLDKLNIGGKLYIEHLTSRLLQGKAQNSVVCPVKTVRIGTKTTSAAKFCETLV